VGHFVEKNRHTEEIGTLTVAKVRIHQDEFLFYIAHPHEKKLWRRGFKGSVESFRIHYSLLKIPASPVFPWEKTFLAKTDQVFRNIFYTF
jgi:hypothetical protein